MNTISSYNAAKVLAVGLSGLTLLPAASVALAQGRSARTVSLSAGTVLPVKLDEALNSKTSLAGDKFTASVTRGKNEGEDAGLPEGSKIEGVVRSAKPQKDKNPGQLDLEFRRLRLPDGKAYPITGALIGLDNKSVDRDKNGHLVARPAARNNRLTYVGYGAGAGLLASLFTKNTFRETLLGAAAGYLYGSLEKDRKPADVNLKEGTTMGVRLDKRLTLSNAVLSDYRTGDGSEGDRLDRSRNDLNTDRERTSQNNDVRDSGGIGVLVNDKDVAFAKNVRPIQMDGNVLVPAAKVLAAADVPFQYNSRERTLTADAPEGPVRISVGSSIAIIDGSKRIKMETAARLRNGSLYVPLRFLSIIMGKEATYDEGSQTVILSRP